MRDDFNLRGVISDPTALDRFHRYMAPDDLVVGGRIQPIWLADDDAFIFAEPSQDGEIWFRVSGKSGERSVLNDAQRARALAQVANQSAADISGNADGHSFRRQNWSAEASVVPEVRSPDGAWMARLDAGNINLRSLSDNRIAALTSDGGADHGWDIEAVRLKMGGDGDLQRRLVDPWSPNSNYLFALKVDRRSVPDLAFVRPLKREEELCTIKIQRAGGPLDVAQPYIIDILSKRAIHLDVGDTLDSYLTLVGWLDDSSEVLFSQHSRDFRSVTIYAADLSGKVRKVLSESADTFVAIQHDVIYFADNHLTLLPDSKGIIWRSSRSGWNQLYHYELGRESSGRQITSGNFAVNDVVAFDSALDRVYFSAHHDPDRPYDLHLCSVNLEGGAVARLTSRDGQNLAKMAPSLSHFVVTNSTPSRPYQTFACSAEGEELACLTQADVGGIEGLGGIISEEFQALAADGETVLWGVLHRPADLDPSKSYPLIDHIYAGPQLSFVSRGFGLGGDTLSRLDRALAQLGYIVFTVDARGTPGRSKAFHDVVYRNWGRHEIADHAAVVRQLADRYPYIDANRVGIWGHSWGGSFATRALAQAPDVFKVAVGSAPGTDVYDSILYEPYLGLPAESREVYDFASNHGWLKHIRGKLLLLVGSADPAIFWHTIEVADFLIKASVDHELVILPDASHAYTGANDRYFVHKLVCHFERYLRVSSECGT